MESFQFKEAWEQLSQVQKEAAEWNEGSLLVLAGPGSGKTRVLTCRIAKILNDTPDKNFRILALTFTNKAADEMRTRVNTMIPGQENRLFIGTFHSFCVEVLRQHGTHIGINPDFKIYSLQSDRQAILNDAVEKVKKCSSLVNDFDKKTLNVIQRLKSLLITPENCADSFKNKEFAERMALIYPAYEEELLKRNALDFDSLIFKAYQLFTKFPAFARRYRMVYPYICIDEFQDTNYAQYSLIRNITGEEHRNLFIVADDDQIIYQWNGASHKRLDEFRKEYFPQVIQLPMNYRCPPEVVRLANNLIKYNFLRQVDKKELVSVHNSCGKDIVRLLNSFPDSEAEMDGVADDIKYFHSEHLNSVIVLARNRKLLESMQRALQDKDISAVISQRKDEFESTPFAWLHSILRLACENNERHLEALCGTFYQFAHIEIDPEDIINYSLSSNLSYLQCWIERIIKISVTSLYKELIDCILCYLIKSRDVRTFSSFVIIWFDKLILESQDSVYNEIFAGYQEEKTVWEELMRKINYSLGEDIILESFLQELQMHSKEITPKPDSVILMTIHGAKGKEFDHVYLIGLVEDELPSFQSKQKGDGSPEMEEERRNCYVAITRACKTLTISYGWKYRSWPKEPSRFLREMGLI